MFFIIYILCLFQVVTFEDTSTFYSGNNFIPFHEMMRYDFGSRLFIKNVIGNSIMFIPYGFFVSLYLKIHKKYQVFLLVGFASICIETTQLIIGRAFDIDDIVLNIIGGVVGYFLYRLFNKIGSMKPHIFKSNWFLNVVTSLLVLSLFIYIWRVII